MQLLPLLARNAPRANLVGIGLGVAVGAAAFGIATMKADSSAEKMMITKDKDKELITNAVIAKDNNETDTLPLGSNLAASIGAALSPDAPLLALIVVATAATAYVNVLTPSAIGDLVAVVQTLANSTEIDPDLVSALLRTPVLHLLALFAAQGLLTAVNINLVTMLGERLSLRLKHDLYQAIMRQDMSFFDKNMQGEIVGRLTQDVSEFKSTFKQFVTQGLRSITQIAFTIFHLLQVSQKLSLVLLTTMPFLYIGMNVYGAFLRRLSKEARIGDSLASGVAAEAVGNIRTVRAFAAEDREVEHYMHAAEEASKLNTLRGFHIGLFQGMINAATGGIILVILAYGGNLVGRGELTGGQVELHSFHVFGQFTFLTVFSQPKLMTYLISTQNAQKSFASLGVLFGQAIKALGSASRIFEYIQLTPTIQSKLNPVVPEYFVGAVEFTNVSFRYPTRPEHLVLDRFSLNIPVGKVIALCGASGSGKSTIGQLIERFYDVTHGSITIDGHDVRDLDPSWIRNQIGYIHQEPVLFAGSVLENIRYGCPGASLAEVRAAAEKANAAAFIESFPRGYETVVGERGVTLSGGQKQRIAIARALLKDPALLILDEATSALDTQSERIVQDALEKLMKGRTVLVIAHRLSTIQNADMIVVMSGDGKEERAHGNVIEMGSHVELLAKRGAYYKLYQQLSSSSAQKVENAFGVLVGMFK
ncbi:hypothetical protein HDU98_002728 [Podochytrium sp. JEL0797]|nr:hypothetical protein HDU98_002728 [Podochytrium sp. JEL0797]